MFMFTTAAIIMQSKRKRFPLNQYLFTNNEFSLLLFGRYMLFGEFARLNTVIKFAYFIGVNVNSPANILRFQPTTLPVSPNGCIGNAHSFTEFINCNWNFVLYHFL